jgi:hypothetical protein
MHAVLLDTNVIIGAAGLSDGMTNGCRRNCVQQVRQWRGAAWLLVVDAEKEILGEYLRYLTRSRAQPDFQGSLAQQLLAQFIDLNGMDDAAARDAGVLLVTLKVTGKNEYDEFPADDPVLDKFDPADRKWIAAALSCRILHEQTPEIRNAIDSDWDAIADHLLQTYRIAVSSICG